MTEKDAIYLKTLTRLCPHPTLIVDEEMEVQWVNPAALQLAGSRAAKGVSLETWFCSESEFLAWREPSTYGAQREGRDERAVRLLAEGGRISWVQVTLVPSGIGTLFFLYLTDISEWKALEAELDQRLESRSYFHQAVSELIVRLNGEGEVVFANPAARNWIAVEQLFADQLEEEHREAWQQTWENLKAFTPSTIPQIWKLRGGTGAALSVEWRVRRLTDPENEMFAGASLIGRDLTPERRLADLCDRAGLTERERELVELVANGYTNVNIAAILGISESGVKYHLRNVFTKTKVASRTELLSLVL